ncbi:hypothetical protein [Mangrovibacillus cuniculi]|uniref:Uncharacterized protein n=1 Tax=Mangrovibacillus cuniculi TaxID=2593652 RepID=A0A7S8CC39_9BACI|nr:hypothetical protein [Mangrovibacillus cuniculi]QPC47249.1 hypothetical protein G8O30_09825 [Mangrovibacillus cuniculi]
MFYALLAVVLLIQVALLFAIFTSVFKKNVRNGIVFLTILLIVFSYQTWTAFQFFPLLGWFTLGLISMMGSISFIVIRRC